jgi:ABC-type lipopolysaccharide export system ATPase subunit
MNRAWVKSYTIVAALTRNPKTPLAQAMSLLQRLNERDLKSLSTDRNVAEPLRLAARKFLVKAKH